MIINNLLFLFFAIKNTLLEKKVCPKHTRTIYVYSYSLCFQGVNVFAIECIQWILSVMIKPREYKLSWPSLFGQGDWMLASFFSYFFSWTETSSQSIKTQKKKKELSQYPAILSSRLVNNAYEYILFRPIQIWQGKTVQKNALPSPKFV